MKDIKASLIDKKMSKSSYLSDDEEFDPDIYNIPKIDDVSQGVVRKLIFVCFLAFLLMGVEIAGGIYSGSLAVLTDAAHMFSDISGFGISIIRHNIILLVNSSINIFIIKNLILL